MRVLTGSNGRRLAVCFAAFQSNALLYLRALLRSGCRPAIPDDRSRACFHTRPVHSTGDGVYIKGRRSDPPTSCGFMRRTHMANRRTAAVVSERADQTHSEPISTGCWQEATNSGENVTRLEVERSSPVLHRRSRRMIAARRSLSVSETKRYRKQDDRQKNTIGTSATWLTPRGVQYPLWRRWPR